jgi:HSP20 family protein
MNVQSLLPWVRSEQVPTPLEQGAQDPFLALHRDVNRLFDETFRSFTGASLAERMAGVGGWPSIEIRDGDEAVRVVAEVPGMRAEDMEILLDDNILTLRGERKSETADKERRFTERFYGRFERRIPLDYAVEADKVSADFRDGVLTVILPKSEEHTRVHRIEVKRKE